MSTSPTIASPSTGRVYARRSAIHASQPAQKAAAPHRRPSAVAYASKAATAASAAL
jgi:hypothetical protein